MTDTPYADLKRSTGWRDELGRQFDDTGSLLWAVGHAEHEFGHLAPGGRPLSARVVKADNPHTRPARLRVDDQLWRCRGEVVAYGNPVEHPQPSLAKHFP